MRNNAGHNARARCFRTKGSGNGKPGVIRCVARKGARRPSHGTARKRHKDRCDGRRQGPVGMQAGRVRDIGIPRDCLINRIFDFFISCLILMSARFIIDRAFGHARRICRRNRKRIDLFLRPRKSAEKRAVKRGGEQRFARGDAAASEKCARRGARCEPRRSAAAGAPVRRRRIRFRPGPACGCRSGTRSGRPAARRVSRRASRGVRPARRSAPDRPRSPPLRRRNTRA